MPWSPSDYLVHAGPRLRPAIDLLARVPDRAVGRAVDLGCGPGTVTALLRARWPDAALTGVDASPEMLARAAAADPGITWVEADLAAWSPAGRFDLVFSNAALHWLVDPTAALARAWGLVGAGGALAVQMPRNFAAPSHALCREVAADSRWADRLADVASLRPAPVPSAREAYAAVRSVAGPGASIDAWETEYVHVLEGTDAALTWLRGTTLVPVLERLGADAPAFVEALRPRLADAYPPGPDGRTPFSFRRVFVVAIAPALPC